MFMKTDHAHAWLTCQQGLMKINICMQHEILSWHTRVCLPAFVLFEFLYLFLFFPKHTDTLSSTHRLKETAQIMKLWSNVAFCNSSETDECLPWSGVPLSARVSGAFEGMDEWVRTEPRRWRWWPSALSRWPPVSADDLMFIFIERNETEYWGAITEQHKHRSIMECKLWSWPLCSARRLCLALRCSSSTHAGRVDGRNTFLCRCHEAW